MPNDIPDPHILDLRIPDFLQGVEKSWGVPPHVPHEDLAFRRLLSLSQPVQVSEAERKWLFNQNVFIGLQREDGVRDMVRICVRYQNHIDISGGSELGGEQCGFGRGTEDVGGAVGECQGGDVAEVGYAEQEG